MTGGADFHGAFSAPFDKFLSPVVKFHIPLTPYSMREIAFDFDISGEDVSPASFTPSGRTGVSIFVISFFK
jgi:hypothetical protein